MIDQEETILGYMAKLVALDALALSDLLAEMQTLHQQMAIVVDEYGGVAGLVTVEDLVEVIVGDIADEFGTLSLDGQVSFGDFLALLGLVGPCD